MLGISLLEGSDLNLIREDFPGKRFRSLYQNSTIYESDCALSNHGVQANRNAFSGRTNDGSNLTVRQRDVDQDTSTFGDAVAMGKIGEKSVKSSRDCI